MCTVFHHSKDYRRSSTSVIRPWFFYMMEMRCIKCHCNLELEPEGFFGIFPSKHKLFFFEATSKIFVVCAIKWSIQQFSESPMCFCWENADPNHVVEALTYKTEKKISAFLNFFCRNIIFLRCFGGV